VRATWVFDRTRSTHSPPKVLNLLFRLIVHATDRLLVKSFARMNGTLKIVFTRKKTAAMTGDLMQSLEVVPVFFEVLPGTPDKSE
jgi:hypothetical protein